MELKVSKEITEIRDKHVCLLSCLIPRRLSLDENVHTKEGGKDTTGETALRLPSIPFPWSLAVHHLLFASTLRKSKRLRRRLSPEHYF